MPILLLIRHATNDFVKTGRLPGRTHGIHLNEEGRAQAEALSKALAGRKLDAVYASHLERAIETALYVARPQGLPVHIRPALADIDNGDFTGRVIKELGEDEKTKDLWKTVVETPSQAKFPNGEGMLEMQQRFVAALDAILEAHPDEKAKEKEKTEDEGPKTEQAPHPPSSPQPTNNQPPATNHQQPPPKTIAVVAHADVIKAALAHYLGMPFDLFQRLGTSPASVSTVAIFTDDKTSKRHIMVQSVNVTAQ